MNLKRFSSHRIFISKNELKHTNNKIIINIYIYNRQKYNYFNILKENFLNINKYNKFYGKNIQNLNKKPKFVNKFGYKFYKKRDFFYKKAGYIDKLNYKLNYIYKHINNKNNFRFYKNLYSKEYLKICSERLILYLFYKRLLLLNQLKLRYTYLQYIINIIKKIYNKDIELNLINLKYFYLNSDIFTKSITNKITKKRTKLNKIFKIATQKVKTINNNKMFLLEEKKRLNLLDLINTIDKDKIKSYLFKNTLNKLILKIYKQSNTKTKRKIILDNINNRYITGVRLEAVGRLSRRFTASRSINKLKYKGSLRNRDSSDKGLSSIVMRGNLKSNLQYTKLSSIANIGSFGIKG